MSKIKKIFTNVRVIILIIFLILALVAIHPNPWAKGVAIRSIAPNSSASIAGIASPSPTTLPMNREVVLKINNQAINTLEDYTKFLSTVKSGRTYSIKTNKGLYTVLSKPVIIWEGNESKEVSVEDLGLKVYEAPKNNIKRGLDLQGGTRVLLQPEKNIDKDSMALLLDSMKQRLNVYGLSDVVVRESGDLIGNQYVLIEIAGANEDEVKELLAKQGKFEAKIKNQTIFMGGKDLTYVCRSSDCSGIDPREGCGQTTDKSWFCRFRFTITMTPEAAQRQADATRDLEVITEGTQKYLSEDIYLFLDDKEVDKLKIGSELKGQASTEIMISGGGAGNTQQEAVFNSLQNMKRLQTILVTGSLPVKLNIVKTDQISPILGEEFIKNAFLVAFAAIFVVALFLSIRYKSLIITLPIMVTMLSEIVLILGLAAFIGWNLDLAAIAGIIISIGTGIDAQIVIVDEIIKKETEHFVNWKKKLERAFFIIFGSYLTVVVAMLPLWFAGAGLLRGFAITTIFGVTFGVFVARPAFAVIAEELLHKE